MLWRMPGDVLQAGGGSSGGLLGVLQGMLGDVMGVV